MTTYADAIRAEYAELIRATYWNPTIKAQKEAHEFTDPWLERHAAATYPVAELVLYGCEHAHNDALYRWSSSREGTEEHVAVHQISQAHAQCLRDMQRCKEQGHIFVSPETLYLNRLTLQRTHRAPFNTPILPWSTRLIDALLRTHPVTWACAVQPSEMARHARLLLPPPAVNREYALHYAREILALLTPR